MKFFALAVLVTLTSCATSYKPSGWGGGYVDQQLAKDMFRVSFKGNGYTDSETVQNYLLRRCAELTLLNGFTHFQVVDAAGGADTSYHTSFNQYATNTYAIQKHQREAIIKMLNNPKEGTIAFDAEMIFGPLQNRGAASLPKSKEIDEME